MPEKLRGKYYFSVEGETEERYLKHLELLLRNAGCIVSFTVKKCSPHVFLKTYSPLQRSIIHHFFDMESNTEKHYIKNFESTLTCIVNTGKDKEIKYLPCYSNLTFELWIVLHKIDFQQALTGRKDYLSLINKAFKTKHQSLKEYKSEKNFNKILNSISLEDVKSAVIRAENIVKNKKANRENKIPFEKYPYYRNDPYTEAGNVIGDILRNCGLLSSYKK